MHIKNTLFEKFGGFTLDMDKIGTTSADKHKIKLNYTGTLPKPYEAATLFVRVTPVDVRLLMVAKMGKETTKYIIEASREEIISILWPFFFKAEGNSHYTRWDNGLTKYWCGSYQSEFMMWYNITECPTARICDIMQNLTKEQRASVYAWTNTIS